MFPLLALSFAFWLVVMTPRFLTCHNSGPRNCPQYDIGSDTAKTIPCEVTSVRVWWFHCAPSLLQCSFSIMMVRI
ncbi:hypothetical protein CEXT_814931 [Caerostris extrusa]|uniref:Secreted protein n=1 Tax=Caerostris extrusa TaxID=172846 RepID=A0AAV4VSH7_CAEEX|nr:hypothetical protein CEXT_814931 [Caerostris extrusa]